MDSENLPPVSILARTKDAFLYSGEDLSPTYFNFETKSDNNITTELTTSADGKLLAFGTNLPNNNILLLDANSFKVIDFINRVNVLHLQLSPLGNYLITFEKASDNINEDNVNIFSTKTKQILKSFYYKSWIGFQLFSNLFQWNKDESVSCSATGKDTIYFYHQNKKDSSDILSLVLTYKHPKPITSYYLNGDINRTLIGIYSASTNNSSPCSFNLYLYPSLTLLASKSFFIGNSNIALNSKNISTNMSSSDSIRVIFSPLHDNAVALIVYTSSSESHYEGNAVLYMLKYSITNTNNNNSFQLPGAIRDVAFNPSPSKHELIVILGSPPPEIYIYSTIDFTPLFKLGHAHRNTIRFSPSGRFIAIGGFGNLIGEIDFWDRNKVKKIGTTKHQSARYYEWAPNGRLFMTAVTRPRTVDNCIRIYSHCGELLSTLDFKELHQVSWRPAKEGIYPDKKLPCLKNKKDDASNLPSQNVEVKTKYIPPHLRRQQNNNNTIPNTSIHPIDNGVTKLSIDSTISKTEKNKLKKEKEKNKKLSKKITQETQAQIDALNMNKSNNELSIYEKKMKALQKKMRQIEELKAKPFDSLNEDQKQKIQTENSVKIAIQTLTDCKFDNL